MTSNAFNAIYVDTVDTKNRTVRITTDFELKL